MTVHMRVDVNDKSTNASTNRAGGHETWRRDGVDFKLDARDSGSIRRFRGDSRERVLGDQYSPMIFHHVPPMMPQMRRFTTPRTPPSLKVVGRSTYPAPK